VGFGKEVNFCSSLCPCSFIESVGQRNLSQVLNKPYSDGGYENSSRVFPNGWDNIGVETGAMVHGCKLNDPSSGPCKGWTAEVKFPLKGLSFNNTNTVPPKDGSYWRIDFSRVCCCNTLAMFGSPDVAYDF